MQVVLRSRGDPVERDGLGDSAAERHAHPLEELLRRVEPLVGGRVLREAERLVRARHDGHFEQGVRVRQEPADEGVAALVVRHDALLARRNHRAALLHAADHPLDGVLEVRARHLFRLVTRGPQCRLVAHVGDVGAAESRRERRHAARVERRRLFQLDRLQVVVEHLLALVERGQVEHDVPVEAARSQQGLVEHVGPVRGREHEHALATRHAVHFDEQLVERLFALAGPTVERAGPFGALASDGVDFVDVNDARRSFARLFEQVPVNQTVAG